MNLFVLNCYLFFIFCWNYNFFWFQTFGFLHVITGPDHLSALATLAATTTTKTRTITTRTITEEEEENDNESSTTKVPVESTTTTTVVVVRNENDNVCDDTTVADNKNDTKYSTTNSIRCCSGSSCTMRIIQCLDDNPIWQAFGLGVRWGIGHSTGLLLVGGTFLVLQSMTNNNSIIETNNSIPSNGYDSNINDSRNEYQTFYNHQDNTDNTDSTKNLIYTSNTLTSSSSSYVEIPTNVTNFFESMVGIFMLCLGIYGIRRAREKFFLQYRGIERVDYYDNDPSHTHLCNSHLYHHHNHPHDVMEYFCDNDNTNPNDINNNKERVYDDTEGTTFGTTFGTSSMKNHHHYRKNENCQNGVCCGCGCPSFVTGVVPWWNKTLYQGNKNNSNILTTERGLFSLSFPNHQHYYTTTNTLADDTEQCVTNTDENDTTKNDRNDKMDSGTVQESSSHVGVVRMDSDDSWGCSVLSTRTMAFAAGILHGLAGPGGVLGVIPAVQLRDAMLGTLYLTSFCLSSMVTMGMFAMLYSTLSRCHVVGGKCNLGNNGSSSSSCSNTSSTSERAYWIECVSASMSIVVGILWLVLLAMGKLDDIFP